MTAALAALAGTPALANPPSVSVTADNDLAFGRMIVFSQGSRTVSYTGTVQDSGVMNLPGSTARPAQFTVTFDRGNQSRRPLDVMIELVVFPASQVIVGGVTARLGQFDSDLPGASVLTAGQVYQIEFANCVTRTCSRTFHVGGRLDVTRAFGGAAIAIPIPVNATLVAMN
ncbi:DUF4402 domain-containing protein [Novosphingobium sp. ZN18A2]|uniref:DUF4402 domain-containing protein n=1 Tax=Novosphingobium sp. ZN18A2 TaxID=3079861 RepID=UPI0030CAA23B